MTDTTTPTACWAWLSTAAWIGWVLYRNDQPIGFVRRIVEHHGHDSVLRWQPLDADQRQLTTHRMDSMASAREAVRSHVRIPADVIAYEPRVCAVVAVART